MLKHVISTIAVNVMLVSSMMVVRGETYTFNHENVLGTSCEIVIQAENIEAAESAEARVLAQIDRLAGVFSTYDPNSELSRILQLPENSTIDISSELGQLLSDCEYWHLKSDGAFNPAAELISRAWAEGEKSQRVLTAETRSDLVNQVELSHWKLLNDKSQVIRTSSIPLSFNAIAKGRIIDLASQAALEGDSRVVGIVLNIGGDIRVAGAMAAEIDIVDPAHDAIGSEAACSIVLEKGAVATSGHSERYHIIHGEKYSHIIDPRTALPVHHIENATVLAKDAATADVLATICSVLPVSESIRLVEEIPGAACRLQTEDGKVLTSRNWHHLRGSDSVALVSAIQKSDDSPQQMLVEFEIGSSDSGRRYRRPYVAVWIEDKDGFPVKTLSLFMMQNDPGPRWYRDLRRWYASDQMRRLADEMDIIKTVSKPTRNPGKYKVEWNGTDDHGVQLKNGKYTLYIEAAREHGTYQLMKYEFQFDKSFETEFKPNAEFSSAKVKYSVK